MEKFAQKICSLNLQSRFSFRPAKPTGFAFRPAYYSPSIFSFRPAVFLPRLSDLQIAPSFQTCQKAFVFHRRAHVLPSSLWCRRLTLSFGACRRAASLADYLSFRLADRAFFSDLPRRLPLFRPADYSASSFRLADRVFSSFRHARVLPLSLVHV